MRKLIEEYSEAAYQCATNSVVCVTPSKNPADWKIPNQYNELIPVPEGCPVVPYFFDGNARECEYLRKRIVETWVRTLLHKSTCDEYSIAGIKRATVQSIPKDITQKFASQEMADAIHAANINPIRLLKNADEPDTGALWGSFVWVDGQCVTPRTKDHAGSIASRSMLIFYGLLKQATK